MKFVRPKVDATIDELIEAGCTLLYFNFSTRRLRLLELSSKFSIILDMSRLKIIADEKIPFLKELFSNFADLHTIPSKEMSPNVIKDYDVLFVRSVTKVNESLLEGTKIRIVGSMTSGIDHIDRRYLRKKGIKLFYAPGSNARSVAEYVIASLITLAKKNGFKLEGKTIGIIGVGNVGTKVAMMCNTLGMKVLLNDPPKYKRTKNKKYLSLKRLSDADIITLHVPLTFTGRYKTFHMVDGNFLKCLKHKTIFINTSRGRVVDEKALLKYYHKLGGLILDVWENEPDINIELLKLVDIGTPHIAGYSLEGKFNASYMVYKKICKYLEIREQIKKDTILPELKKNIVVSIKNNDLIEILYQIIGKVYNPMTDYKRFMEIVNLPASERKNFFESLRTNYPVRREFCNYSIVAKNLLHSISEKISALGFEVKITYGDPAINLK
ncbi:MAG: 4-phosphoerythronate dehydrogenase [candidate division WOR-3 bacterium]|nr:4-phosphoerythronate dehydrogenase [candidate division WOR-3 bacterium]